MKSLLKQALQNKKVRIALQIAPFAVILFGSYLAANSLKDIFFGAESTREVVEDAKRLDAMLLNLEVSRERAMLVNEAFSRDEYMALNEEFDARIAELEAEVRDDPSQIARLESVKELKAAWRHNVSRTVSDAELASAGPFEESRHDDYALDAAGSMATRLMAAMKEQVNEFTKSQRVASYERSAKAESAVGLLYALLIVTVFYFLMYRFNGSRRRGEAR
jgi:CHASE3 domain sensor protein